MKIEGSFFLDITRPFSQNLCELLNGAIAAGELRPGLDIRANTLVAAYMNRLRG